MQTAQKTISSQAPRILVVDDEPALLEVFRDTVAADLPCQLISASCVQEALDAINRDEIDLLVTDVVLPDGNGLALVKELHRRRPNAAALVTTGVVTLDVAVGALRCGAVDFLPKPYRADELARRVRQALATQRKTQRKQDQLAKLKSAFKRLNAARHTVSKKVDLLCKDLIGAYGELSRQFDGLRLQESYRKCIGSAASLEQLLCHTLDWLMRQMGYSNIGLWLASSDQELQLGAYLKYTLPASDELNKALAQNLLRLVQRRGFLRLNGPALKQNLTPPELKHLAGQDVLAINCTYMGETLAVMLLFRDEKTPFSDDDLAALKAAAPLFGIALARSVKGASGHDAESDDDETPEHKPKKDSSDWWKTGGPPPF